MKITIEPDREKKNVFTLLVDEEPWAQFHKKIFGTSPKFRSKTLAKLCEEFVEKEWKQAKIFALKCLSRKSYHSLELKRLLTECLINEVIINEVIEECQQMGYLDDEEVLKRLMQSKKEGPRKILWKIRRKGIDDERVEQKLTEHYPVEDQLHQIKTLLETKYRSKDLTCPKEKQKVMASLARRGFSYDLINQVLGYEA